jgi:hypothetical protein
MNKERKGEESGKEGIKREKVKRVREEKKRAEDVGNQMGECKDHRMLAVEMRWRKGGRGMARGSRRWMGMRKGRREGEGEDGGREPRTREVEVSLWVEDRRRRHGTEDLITGRMRIVGGEGGGTIL